MSDVEETKEKILHNKLVRYLIEGEEPIAIELYYERGRRLNKALYYLILAFVFGAISRVFDLVDNYNLLPFVEFYVYDVARYTFSALALISSIVVLRLILNARKSIIRGEIYDKRLLQKDI